MCDVPYCRQEGGIQYYGKVICDRCWDKHCDEERSFDLKKVFKIKGKVV